jgi:2-hydroxy-6-oxo-6-(2'-aminophenyl)hexa-2,4-dienoate hydrolase
MGAFDRELGGLQSHYVDAAGIRTHYIEVGRGAPVILVHGGGPGADGYGNWQGCLPGFSEHFRTIAVDMVGFGRSAKPDPASFEYSQQDRNRHLAAFIEALGLQEVSLVGNSMGGCTSLGVCMQRPELVHKLVLMGSAGIKTSEIPKALGPLMSYDGTEPAMRKVIAALTNSAFRIDDGMLRYRVELSNQPDALKALGATMGWIKARHGLYYEEDEIRRVKTPTLVIAGKDDPIVTLAQNNEFLRLLDNSWGHFIPHSGHWVMIEHPEEFVAVTSQFLQQ